MRALGQGVHLEAIVVYLAHPQQAGGGHLAPPGFRTGGIPSRSSSSLLLPRPKGRSGELPPLLSHWEGLRPSQTLPQSSEARWASSSTVCSRS